MDEVLHQVDDVNTKVSGRSHALAFPEGPATGCRGGRGLHRGAVDEVNTMQQGVATSLFHSGRSRRWTGCGQGPLPCCICRYLPMADAVDTTGVAVGTLLYAGAP